MAQEEYLSDYRTFIKVVQERRRGVMEKKKVDVVAHIGNPTLC